MPAATQTPTAFMASCPAGALPVGPTIGAESLIIITGLIGIFFALFLHRRVAAVRLDVAQVEAPLVLR